MLKNQLILHKTWQGFVLVLHLFITSCTTKLNCGQLFVFIISSLKFFLILLESLLLKLGCLPENDNYFTHKKILSEDDTLIKLALFILQNS